MLVIMQELKLQRASDHSIKLELKLYRKNVSLPALTSLPYAHTHCTPATHQPDGTEFS